jgi:hypothetical protein
MKMNLLKKEKGSALLVTILVMAILMTITLGLSTLVVSEIRQTGDVVAAGKAYYAAEAGMENALLDLHEHLPGYQTKNIPTDAEGWVTFTDDNLDYRYRIRNQGDSYPYFDSDEPVFLQPGVGLTVAQVKQLAPEATYNALPLHQTVTVPLFVDCGDGNYMDVKRFLLEYYVKFKLPPEISGKLSAFDILRWKLFGQPSRAVMPGQSARTDAISDFYPATDNASATLPVCIGSDHSMLDKYGCIAPVVNYSGDLPQDVPDWSKVTGAVGASFDAAWGAARECYTDDSGGVVGSTVAGSDEKIQKNCSIGTFMEGHTKNYLTITNVVNPDIIDLTNPDAQSRAANIYYRVVAEKDPANQCPGASADSSSDVMVRESADISADGYANGKTVTQSVNAKLKLNSFLPVFNFSLFRTDPSKADPDAATPNAFPLGL